MTGTLWLVWVRLGTGSGSGPQQGARESVGVSSTEPRTLEFSGGPDNNDLSRDIALSLQETPGVAGDTGWLFRSGRLSSLPVPPQTLDIVVCPSVRFDAAALLNESAKARSVRSPSWTPTGPGPPMGTVLADGVTVRTATITTVAGGFVLAISGSSPSPFSHSLMVTLSPSSDQHFPNTILDASYVDAGTDAGVVTTAARDFARAVAAEVVSGVATIVERNAIQSLGAVVTPPPAPGTGSGPLPPTVVLSIRRVVATSSGLAVLPALGAFGNVDALLFPQRATTTPGSGTKCFGSSLSSLLQLSLNLEPFRVHRDTVLARDRCRSTCNRRVLPLRI